MPKVTFVDGRGQRVTVEVVTGTTVMQAAIDNGVLGIVGECGGACQCATCHVYVEERWSARLPAPSDMELAMLEGVYAEQRPSSRLGCEILVTDELDGLQLQLPERQR